MDEAGGELLEEGELEDDAAADDEAPVEVLEAEAEGIAASAAADGEDASAEGSWDEPPPHDVQMSAAAKTAITVLIARTSPWHLVPCADP